MFKLLVLIVLIAIVCVVLARLRARLPWNDVTRRANRRGLLKQPVDGETQDRVINLLMQGKKLGAIRALRRETGLGFRDTKLLVEAIEAGHRPARVIRGEATEG